MAEEETTTTTSDDASQEDLGDAGKRALEAERQTARAAEKARKAAEKRATELEDRLSKIEADNQSESEKALAKAREEAAAEARTDVLATTSARLLKAEVRAAAGGLLADPEDAVRLLDLDDFTVAEDGEVDRAPLDAAIADLLKAKPYLAPNGRAPTGSLDQGARPDTKAEVTPGLGRLRAAYEQSSKSK